MHRERAEGIGSGVPVTAKCSDGRPLDATDLKNRAALACGAKGQWRDSQCELEERQWKGSGRQCEAVEWQWIGSGRVMKRQCEVVGRQWKGSKKGSDKGRGRSWKCSGQR